MPKRKQAGFTLIELLIAIAILLVAVVAIVPLFVFTIESAQMNNMKNTAARVSSSDIEKIRSLEFSKIGLEGGNPPGDLKAEIKDTIDGIDYFIYRSISWAQKGNPCDLETSEAPLWDYKAIKIRVEAKTPKGKIVTEEMETLIARSSFQEPSPTSGIRICVAKGWGEENTPIAGAKVTIEGPDGSAVQQWTTSTNEGAALFFLTHNKDVEYKVKVEAPKGMMVIPDSTEFIANVPKDKWYSKRVYMEYPCFVNLILKDRLTNNNISGSGKLVLTSRFNPTGEIKDFFYSPIDKDVLGPLWPLGVGETGTYGLNILDVKDYYDSKYENNSIFMEDGMLWSGDFFNPRETLTLTAYLLPIPITPDDTIPATDENLMWLTGTSIQTEPSERDARDQKVLWNASGTITQNANNELLIAKEMYWESKVDTKGNNLNIAAELFKFAEPIILGSSGSLILELPGGAGIKGSQINGGNSDIKYGKVHFVSGVFEDTTMDTTVVEKGAYYFPNNLILPDSSNQLIPFHVID